MSKIWPKEFKFIHQSTDPQTTSHLPSKSI
ncbi:Protein of unknown function [Pyronema omphalodes CBS 100304]|uniref:Uncharacterized protein n=1 Tax=Pyronema omphalodes (strain CBS 100304) TaxID=1076935 RepID=U4LU55_PYROM|nr:Protein of unknown function [Pyronema omphalodes CBS 100304]